MEIGLLLLVPLIVIAIIYGLLVKRGFYSIATFLMIVLIVGFIGSGIVTAYLFAGLFGFIGCFMWIPIGCIGMGIYQWIVLRHSSEKMKISPKQSLWLRSGLVVLLLITLAPATSAVIYSGTCNNLIERTGQPLIDAVLQYYEATGQYPESLQALIPTYIEAIPDVPCIEPFRWYPSADVQPYEIVFCRSNAVILEVSSMDDAFPYRYDFATGRWSRISFFDGVCSFLGS